MPAISNTLESAAGGADVGVGELFAGDDAAETDAAVQRAAKKNETGLNILWFYPKHRHAKRNLASTLADCHERDKPSTGATAVSQGRWDRRPAGRWSSET